MDLTSVDAARRELTDFTVCPACATPLRGTRCGACGLGVAGADGARIADASRTAARALDERHRVIGEIRTAQAAAARHAAVPSYAMAAPAVPPYAMPTYATPAPSLPAPTPPAPTPPALAGSASAGPAPAERPFDVARLFALAGAGLVAAAALVFAFFVLSDAPAARVAVLLLATAAAAAGTLTLRRRGIGSSAEAVGGLAAALAVVDAWVVAMLADGPERWVVLALLLLAVGLGLPAAGWAVRVRAWTVAVLVLPFVPLCVAGAVGGPWAWHLGLLAAALVTLVRIGYRSEVGRRFGVRTTGMDRALALAATVLLVLALIVGAALPDPVPGWESGAFAIALLLGAVVASAQAQAGRPRAWTWTAGALAVLAGVVTPLGVLSAGIGLGPVLGAAVWALLVLPPMLAPRPLDANPRYRALVSGGWTALVASTIPGALAGVGGTLGLLGGLGPGVPRQLDPGAFDRPDAAVGIGPVLALMVLAGALAAIGRLRLAPVLSRVPVPASVPLPPTHTPPLSHTPPLPPSPAPPTPPTSLAVPSLPPSPPRLPVPRPPAVVAIGRACLPTATVLALWVAVGLLHVWSVPLLVAELGLAIFLVEGARWVPGRNRSGAAPVPGAPQHPVLAPSPPLAASLPPASPVPGSPLPVPPPPPRGTAPWRGTLTGAAFAQIVLFTALTWVSRPTVAVGAVAVGFLLLRARRLVITELRGLLVGMAAAYAGVVVAVLLAWAGWDAHGVLGAVAVVLCGAAVLLTVLPRVGRDSWFAVLLVAAVPASLSIAAVVAERTWWSAGTAAALLVLEVVLLDTGARRVPAALRVLAAALIVPTVSVVVICAGALLLPGSGSPVLLPVVATLAAAVAIAAPAVAGRLRRRTVDLAAEHARLALEVSAAATAAVALLLAVGRASTGADTVLVLCAILGAGATAVAQRPDRRAVWWLAGVLWSGVLWSALAWWGVGLVEAYTAPPALAAVLVGTLLTRRSDRWLSLVGAGVALLVLPTLALATAGVETGMRSAVLLALAVVLLGAALAVDRPGTGDGGTADALRTQAPAGAPRALGSAGALRGHGSAGALRALVEPLALGGGAAALAGAVRAAHLAAAAPPGSAADNARLFGHALTWSFAGAALLGLAGVLIAGRRVRLAEAGTPSAGSTRADAARWADLLRRWALAPALIAGTVGALVALRPSWAGVWTGWLAEIVLLVLAVRVVATDAAATNPPGGNPEAGSPVAGSPVGTPVAARPWRGAAPVLLPPGWFLWLAALAWAIGAWSTRALRVEVFALPLGLALTALGLVALRAVLAADHDVGARSGRPGARVSAGASPGWPVGSRGSAATLTPGILATLGPSMLAIWTDPMTWRAILVVALALGFMLLGARQMLRAPLVVGAAALPIAVISVFAAQIGGTISAGPWLLTLLAAGGLLLVLGIFAERRRAVALAGGDVGVVRALR